MDTSQTAPELSVVIPCLNEEETLAHCITTCRDTIAQHGIRGEIIVADNGSTDGSAHIAAEHGCRVVHVRERGYGNALRGGIAQARGAYIIMGDADGSYDFRDIPRFLARLRQGNDIVLGCRFPTGGGRIVRGAMPPLHRFLGNPLLSLLVRWWFRAPIHDVYCGLRGCARELVKRLHLQCEGMEFATEMVIKSSVFGMRMAEVPITLHPDGRKTVRSHLRTFRDGWRTLLLFLTYSPRWLFLIPGSLLLLAGGIGYALALPGVTVGRIHFDAHTLMIASLSLLLGYQVLHCAIMAKMLAVMHGLLPPDRSLEALVRRLPLEYGIILGVGAIGGGLLLILLAVWQWQSTGFGNLDYGSTMRLVIPGVTLCALGAQTIASSFLLSLLRPPPHAMDRTSP